MPWEIMPGVRSISKCPFHSSLSSVHWGQFSCLCSSLMKMYACLSSSEPVPWSGAPLSCSVVETTRHAQMRASAAWQPSGPLTSLVPSQSFHTRTIPTDTDTAAKQLALGLAYHTWDNWGWGWDCLGTLSLVIPGTLLWSNSSPLIWL